MFYLFYPVSCPLFFPFSATVRKEFRLYAGLLASVTLALFVDIIWTYSNTYPPHLGPIHAVLYGSMRLFICFLVFVAFFIPVATTSFTYQLSERPWRMRLLVIIGIFSALPMFWLVHEVFAESPWWPGVLLSSRMATPGFREELKRETEMFLLYNSARMPEGDYSSPAVHTGLTKEYRRRISWLAVREEVFLFEVFTLPGEPPGSGRPWLGLKARLPYHRTVGMASPDGQFFSSWHKLPPAIQQRFQLNPNYAQKKGKVEIIHAQELIDDFH
jgi:hypothetical protein